jgi:hypothetical protein
MLYNFSGGGYRKSGTRHRAEIALPPLLWVMVQTRGAGAIGEWPQTATLGKPDGGL